MLGFTQELFVNGNEEMPPEVAAIMLQQMAARYSHLGELMRAVHHDTGSVLGSGCDDQFEFEFGLDLTLDGLEAAATVDLPAVRASPLDGLTPYVSNLHHTLTAYAYGVRPTREMRLREDSE